MSAKINSQKLSEDIRMILKRHNLNVQAFGISLSILGSDFDVIASDYPDHHPEMLLMRDDKGTQWFIKIVRLRSADDFPPGAILTPPPDE